MADRTPAQRAVRRFLIHPLQGAVILVLFVLCRVAPLSWGSNLGSAILKILGPRLKGDKVARKNLAVAYPDISQPELDILMGRVWDNLGRVAGEWAKVDTIRTTGPGSRVTVEGEEVIAALRESGKPFIMVGGHLGNWELICLIFAQRGLPLAAIYRQASIPVVEILFRNIRSRFIAELIPKARSQARRIVEVLRAGKPLGLLVDQKLNEGLPIPFFGRDAMTAAAPAELALRYDCPLILVRGERLPGQRFRFTIQPPLKMPAGGTREEKVREILTRINASLERWIREDPAQWLWIHRRWPD